MMASKDFEVASPPTDGISALAFSPVADHLAAASWDHQVRVWEVQASGQTIPRTAVQHDAPVLCTAWMKDGMKLFSAGGSKQGRLLDLPTGQSIPFAQHDAPIKCCAFFDTPTMQNILVTGGWDKTLKYWDTRTNAQVASVMLPERCYTMDVLSPVMVVGTAERHILVYDLNNPNQPFKTMSSPLKQQTRCVSIFTDRSGFAVGSIEGRVAIQYIQDSDQSKNFSFKCHRDGSNVYSVNAISFHPTYGTFSTAGADGTMNFWDKDSKQRLKSFNNIGQSISATAFNRDGRIFAYAASYDWHKGHEHHRQDQKDKIFLHPVQEKDIEPRTALKKR